MKKILNYMKNQNELIKELEIIYDIYVIYREKFVPKVLFEFISSD